MKDNENNNRPYGQPYYDENGILHTGMTEQSTDEEYENQYRRQMEEYRKMYGDDFENQETLEFIPYKYRYKYAAENGEENFYQNTQNPENPQNNQYNQYAENGENQRQNTNTSRQNSPQRNTQRPSQTSGNRKNSHSGQSSGRRNSAFNVKKTTSKNTAGKSKGKTNNKSSGRTSPQKRNNTNSRSKGNSKNMKKRKHPVRTFFTILIIIILILVVGLNVLLLSYIGKINKLEKGERTITNASIKSDNVRNVLVIGSDSRDPKDRGRTDTIILLSINKDTRQITMTSFMRDMYVNIKGKNDDGENVDTWGKINAAYVYGGAELLMDTIEQNFDVAIDDYVYFGFDSFIDIVDAVGGVEISVTDEEAEGMQPQTMEINDISGREHTKDILEKGGKYNMNGYQALAYARLRYVGNADFQRTERQREVISKIIEKVKKNPLSITKFGNTAAKSVSTNMTTGEIYLLFYKCLFSLKYDIKDLRLPDDNSYQGGTHDGQSTLDVDFEACKKLIKERIYSGISEDDE